VLFVGLAVVVGVQRVLHAAHFVSDVVAGVVVAGVVVRLTLQLFFPRRAACKHAG